MQTFMCDRLTPIRRTPVQFMIEANNGADAAKMADALAYASAFVEGSYPDEHHRSCEQWLQVEAAASMAGTEPEWAKRRDARRNRSGPGLEEPQPQKRRSPKRRKKA